MTLRVLISGCGIAGTAAAHWLLKRGVEVTMVERASHFEPLGHYISLKSRGVALAKEMGIFAACKQREAPVHGMRALDASGRLMREIDPSAVEAAVDGYILFRRADLHAALYETIRDDVAVRFGTELGAIRQDAGGVEVEIGGATERFDLVLGTDGVHSRTRKLAFGEGFERPMGGRYIALTVDGEHGVAPGRMSMFFGHGQIVGLIPTSSSRLSMVVYHGDGAAKLEGRDAKSVRTFLQRAYTQFAPEVQRAFEAIDDHAFVFSDVITMIKMPSIVRGRVALIGDAAHCPTFMSGMGSSLALQGAHVLAGALDRHPTDLSATLAEYERAVTPIAASYQRSAGVMRQLLLGRSDIVASLRDAIIEHTPGWFSAAQSKRFYHTATAERATRP
jgi:2-polyprenyl-6-methoxyphenol hydroxylase-like FAD-dependent oxidoreductase